MGNVSATPTTRNCYKGNSTITLSIAKEVTLFIFTGQSHECRLTTDVHHDFKPFSWLMCGKSGSLQIWHADNLTLTVQFGTVIVYSL
jgi:hypothetical protein